MKLSTQGARFIAKHEGFVPRWYRDPVGIPTIGHGFTWRSASFRAWWAKNRPGVDFREGVTMTRAEAAEVLGILVSEEYGPPVSKEWGKVSQHVYDGGSSVCFNAGGRSLSWKWSQAIKRGDIAGGARLLKTTAVTAKGRRLNGLVRRRSEEAALIQFGQYGAAASAPVSDGVLRRGSSGPKVAALIRGLHKLGHYDGKLDDIFGRGTEAAVLSFQRAEGLKADGWAGNTTLKRLEARLAGDTSAEPTPSAAPAIAKLVALFFSFFS